MSKEPVIYKSNYLIKASYHLTLIEQKLVLCCLSKIMHSKKKPIPVPKIMKITASEYSELTGCSMDSAYKALKEGADKLYERSIKISDPEADFREARWVQERAQYSKGAGSVEIMWSDRVLKYIGELSGYYTKYELRHVAHLSSPYAIRLYELLIQMNNTQHKSREFELDELREILGIEGKYLVFRNLNHHVISPAIKDINTKSNITAKFEKIKHGRKITGVKFSFEPENQKSFNFDTTNKAIAELKNQMGI